MNRNEEIKKLVDDAISSVDNIKRASPLPFLLTRVRIRINNTTENIWEKAGFFIGRPSIAIPGLIMLIFINVLVVVFNNADSITSGMEQTSQASGDEFSFAVGTFYDIENTEP